MQTYGSPMPPGPGFAGRGGLEREIIATCGPALWDLLTRRLNLCVAVVDGQGRIAYANEPFVCRCGRARTLSGLMGERQASVWLGHIRRALESGEALTVDSSRQGRRMRTVIRPLPPCADGTPRALLVRRPVADRLPDGVADAEHVEADTESLGRLGALTPREMDVLRLIGEGLSTAQIADRLHRSTKTIEWHRASLGSKLGVRSRVELARIAIMAGLCGLPSEAVIRTDEPELPASTDN